MVLVIASAVLGAIVLGTFCLLVVYETVNGHPETYKDAFLVLVSVVSGVLFGSHATANGTVATAKNLIGALQQSVPVTNETVHQPTS